MIFPGYPNSCEDSYYSEVLEIYRENGFDRVPADIDWSKNIADNLVKADKIIDGCSNEEELHLFGHSWGAVCALWASRNHNEESQILASLSPEFEEDLQQYPDWGRKLGHVIRGIMDIFGRSGNLDSPPKLEKLKDKDLGEIKLLYGEKEYYGYYGIKYLGFGHYVSENRLEMISNSEEIVVGDAGHRFNENYVDAIVEIISDLD